MYGGEWNAATAKAAAAVTRVQSPGQEVGSGDKGLGVFMFWFVISRNELLGAGGPRTSVETSPRLSTENCRTL